MGSCSLGHHRFLDCCFSLSRYFAWLRNVLLLLFCLPRWTLAQTTVNIHAIQTDLPNSPYLGQSITTGEIVAAVLSDGVL